MNLPFGKFSDTAALVAGNQGEACLALYKCYAERPMTTAAMNCATTCCADASLSNDRCRGDCIVGEICAIGSIVPSLCWPGTYSNEANLDAVAAADCLNCPVGYYCPEWGLTLT
jgi:hypothetical protein